MSFHFVISVFQKHNWEPVKAVEFIKTKRRHILLREKQWEALRMYYQENVLDNSNHKKNNSPNIGLT